MIAPPAPPPLVIDGPVPLGLPYPAYPLPGRARERRPLFVHEREIWMRAPDGWIRIPRGYVTDFASIPWLASTLTCMRLEPLGRWAWGAGGHDWRFAIGEPGGKPAADETLRDRMAKDGVDGFDRAVIYQAVHLFGGPGYAQAPSWWASANFADPDTGSYPVPVPFPREMAFAGHPFGLRPQPDWPSLPLAA